MIRERELFKRAITALIETRVTDISTKHQSLIDEIEELLAQPEPEPIYIVGKGWQCNEMPPEGVKLYTAPQKRQPLSDEAICEILLKKEWKKGIVEFARAIEKAHGIRVE